MTNNQDQRNYDQGTKVHVDLQASGLLFTTTDVGFHHGPVADPKNAADSNPTEKTWVCLTMVYIGVPKIRANSVMNDHFPNQLATCGVYPIYPIFRHYLSDIQCHVHCYGLPLALVWSIARSVALMLIRGSGGIERQW